MSIKTMIYRPPTFRFLTGVSSLFFFLSLSCLAASVIAEEEIFVDGIVASVNGVPITLSEVVARTGGSFPTSLSAASRDEKIQFTLQQMITEQLLRAEAQERRLNVSSEEVNRYVHRIAEQNGITVQEFEDALQREGKTLALYREQIEVEILRTKLARALMRDGITVGEQEIKAYIQDHKDLSGEGAKLKLRQILLPKGSLSKEDAYAKLEEIRAKVSSQEEFADAAALHSQSPEAAEGGLLGVLSEEDLRGPIFDALFKLPEGTVSEVVESGRGYHLFYVETRFVSGDDEEETGEKLREEVREELERRKMDEKLRLYFAQELTAKFAVDKKI
jgi:parvulin-like peptidyl-prolyl isomerase